MPAAQETYLHGHHDSVLRSHRWRTAANSAAYLLPRLAPSARLLDIGCGPGTITADLAALVPGGEVVAIDLAPGILEDARAEAGRRGLLNISFEVGDVYRLAFADDSFDVIHAHQVLQHLSDPVAALAEMRRVCRPGGVVAARDGDYGGMFWYPAEPCLGEWQDLYRKVARSLGGEPDAGRRLLSWAGRVGFTAVEASSGSWCYASAQDRAWWGASWADRLTKSALGDRAVERGFADRSDLDRLAEGWHRWASSGDAWFCVPHGEILCTK